MKRHFGLPYTYITPILLYIYIYIIEDEYPSKLCPLVVTQYNKFKKNTFETVYSCAKWI